jgi:hypothetical protein
MRLRPGENPPGLVAVTPESRRSVRRSGSEVGVSVSSADTVGFLKLKIFEAIGDAVPVNQVYE